MTAKTGTNRAAIVKVLTEASRPMHTKEIAQKTGLTVSQVSGPLVQLTELHSLKRIARGTYTLNGSSSNSATSNGNAVNGAAVHEMSANGKSATTSSKRPTGSGTRRAKTRATAKKATPTTPGTSSAPDAPASSRPAPTRGQLNRIARLWNDVFDCNLAADDIKLALTLSDRVRD